MGGYKITDTTHSGRPVWKSSFREDRYLFYSGISILLERYNNELFIPIFQDDWSRWVVWKEVSNTGAYIMSKKKDLVFLPERGWQYAGDAWEDDNTLRVIGKIILCCDPTNRELLISRIQLLHCLT